LELPSAVSCNVGATVKLIEFASKTGAALHFVSSLGVQAPPSGCMDVLTESFDLPLPDPGASGYSQSKWLAKQDLARITDCGLLVKVDMPGLVVGHSRLGNIPYWFTMALKACILTGACTAFPFNLHGITADAFYDSLVHSVVSKSKDT
jgi:thioester reductase-like protein